MVKVNLFEYRHTYNCYRNNRTNLFEHRWVYSCYKAIKGRIMTE